MLPPLSLMLLSSHSFTLSLMLLSSHSFTLSHAFN
ncbi:hypothetical protein GLYMA_20G185933v4 [Glycine max]|nr:hypothetical protein GLYMA_20G185933v4 [Glycine max]KAH1036810.1 hypothetical protein GYH30_056301 [Glycine max]